MDEQTLQAIYNAYKNGQMTPDEESEYEADLAAGRIRLPAAQGSVELLTEEELAGTAAEAPAEAAEAPAETPAEAPILDSGIYYAYQSGQMSPDEQAALEADIEAGKWRLPEGMVLAPELQAKMEELGILGRLGEYVTGSLRGTPDTEKLPDIGYLPELSEITLKGIKTGFGHMTASNEEFLQILQSNYPGVQVRQDAKGNAIVKSSIDGKEYALKPGFRVSDIPKAIGGILMFTPAGRATTTVGQIGAAAATQAGIETGQKLAGGEFSVSEPITEGLTAGAFHGISKVPSALKKSVIEKPVEELSEKVTADTLKKAVKGSEKAKGILAAQAAPDAETVKAAEELGILDYLQPEHITTGQRYREVTTAAKSLPGSKLLAAEAQTLERLAESANDLISKYGGTTKLGDLDAAIKTKMKGIQGQLLDEAENLYGLLRSQVPPKTLVNPVETLGFIQSRLKTRKGLPQNLSKEERMILRKLKPEPKETGKLEFPTYDLLDDVRKDIVRALEKRTGPFKDADTGLLEQIEQQLLKDQERVVGAVGTADSKDIFKFARQSTAIRKSLEKDMKAIFGRALDGSLVHGLAAGVNNLKRQDVMELAKFIKAVPEEMRQEVMASGLSTAFSKNLASGKFSPRAFVDWYDALSHNTQAITLVFSNLPADARRDLRNLYKVSKSIADVAETAGKGKRLRMQYNELLEADNLMSRIYGTAKKLTPGLLLEVPARAVGFRGAGMTAAIMSAMQTKGKSSILRAADELISSPEFIELAGKGTPVAADRLARSRSWKQFFKELGEPKELSNPSQWLLKSWQAKPSEEESE